MIYYYHAASSYFYSDNPMYRIACFISSNLAGYIFLQLMNIIIKENSWLGRQAARRLKSPNAAIVIKNDIHLWGVSKTAFLQNLSWTRHEVAHVHQYQQYGVLRFIFLYLMETAQKGYYNNRFEAEARNKEEDQSLLDNVNFI